MESKLCRICGKTSRIYVNIFRTEGLSNKLETCLPIIISPHSLLPDYLCSECNENVNNFYIFIKNCLSNIIILESQLNIYDSCLKTKRKHDKSCATIDFQCTKSVDDEFDINFYKEKIISFGAKIADVEKALDSKSVNKSRLVDYDISGDENDDKSTQKHDFINEILARKCEKRKATTVLNVCAKICKLDTNRRKRRPPVKVQMKEISNDESIWDFEVNEYNHLSAKLKLNGDTKNDDLAGLPLVCLLCDTQFESQTLLGAHVFEIHGIDMAQVVSSEPIMEKKKKIPDLLKIGDLKQKRDLNADDSSSDIAEEDASPPVNQCPLCAEAYTNKSELFVHLRLSHPSKAHLICGLCLFIASSYLNLTDHLQTCGDLHQIANPFICKVCKYSEDNVKSLENHVLVHDFIITFCKKEGKIYDPNDYVEVNKNAVLSKNLNCLECGQDFAHFREFSAHRRATHSIFHCDLCNKFYGRNSHLWKHVNRLHKGHPSITCQLCYKTSASKYHLAQHFNKIHQKAAITKVGKSAEDEFLSRKFDGFDFQSVKQSFMRQERLKNNEIAAKNATNCAENDLKAPKNEPKMHENDAKLLKIDDNQSNYDQNILEADTNALIDKNKSNDENNQKCAKFDLNSSNKNDLNAIKNDSNALKTDSNALKNDSNALKNASNAFKNNSNAFKNDPNALKTASNALKNDSNALKNVSNALKNDPNALKNASNALKNDSNALKNGSNALKNDPNALKNASNALKNDPNALKNVSNALKNDSNAFKNASNALKNDSNALKNASNALKNDPNALKNVSNALKNDSNAFKNASNALKNDSNALKNGSNALKNASNALKNDPNALKNDSNALKNDPNAFKNDSNAFKNNLNAFKNDSNALKNDSNACQNYSNALNNDLNQSKNLIQSKINDLNYINEESDANIQAKISSMEEDIEIFTSEIASEYDVYTTESDFSVIKRIKIELNEMDESIDSNQINLGFKQAKLGSNQIKLGSNQIKLGSNQIKFGSNETKLGLNLLLNNEIESINDSQLKGDSSQILGDDSQIIGVGSQIISDDSQIIGDDSQIIAIDSQIIAVDSNHGLKDDLFETNQTLCDAIDANLCNENDLFFGDLSDDTIDDLSQSDSLVKAVAQTNLSESDDSKLVLEQADEGRLTRMQLKRMSQNDSQSDSQGEIITHLGGFRCPKCAKSFDKKAFLKKHKKNCRPRLQKDLLTRCKSCSRIFKDRQSLSKHLINYHSEYECEICKEKVESKCEIVSHIRFTHPDCHLFCYCGNILRNADDLRTHQREHVDSNVCQFCADVLPSKIKLKMHILSLHRKILSLSCGICLKLFENQHLLRDHVQLLHETKLLATSCTVCGKNYGSKWKTYDHLNKSHGRVFKPCRICLNVFNSEEELQKHAKAKHSPKNVDKASAKRKISEPINSSESLAYEENAFFKAGDDKKMSLLERRLIGLQSNDAKSFVAFPGADEPQLSQDSFEPLIIPQRGKFIRGGKKGAKKGRKLEVDDSPGGVANTSKRTVYEDSDLPSVCELCQKTWPAKKHLWQHYIRCHKSEAATICGICLKTNASYDSLQKHLQLMHPNLLHGQGFGSNFICRICGRYHNASSKLRLHMAIHDHCNEELGSGGASNQMIGEDPIKYVKSELINEELINYESLIEQVEYSSDETNELDDDDFKNVQVLQTLDDSTSSSSDASDSSDAPLLSFDEPIKRVIKSEELYADELFIDDVKSEPHDVVIQNMNLYARQPEVVDSAVKSICFDAIGSDLSAASADFCELVTQNLNPSEILSAVDSIL